MSNKALQAQWDVSHTVFNSFKALRELITASGEDDVQSGAVIAAEALGAGFLISPKRYDAAIDALNNSPSFTMKTLQVTLGLDSGGLRPIFRKSSSLLQFFVVLAACKPIFVDEDVGRLFHQMLLQSELLKKYPVSAGQLVALVQQLSGHAEAIVPVDLMHNLASEIVEYMPDSGIFSPLPSSALAEILVNFFQCLSDTTVTAITISGHSNAVWLSTTLLWLLEDDGCIYIGDKVVAGVPDCRVTVQILYEIHQPWKVQAWRKGKSPTEHVYKIDHDPISTIKRLPLRMVRTYLDNRFWSQYEDAELRATASDRCGEIATALVLLLLECGEIKEQAVNTCLKNVVASDWIDEAMHVIVRYGWSKPNQRASAELLAKLENVYRDLLPSARISNQFVTWMTKDLRNCCIGYIYSRQKDSFKEKREVDHIMDYAWSVAYDAIITSTCILEDCERYFSLSSLENIHTYEEDMVSMLYEALPVRNFRYLAMQQIIPGLTYYPDSSLVLSANGIVGAFSLLQVSVADQRRALQIRIFRGMIKKDNDHFNCVEEPEVPYSTRSRHTLETMTVQQMPQNQHFEIKLPPPQPRWDFSVEFAYAGKTLQVRQFMVLRDELKNPSTFVKPNSRRRISWLEAIETLSTATYVNPWENAPTLQMSLGDGTRDQSLADPVYWAHPYIRLTWPYREDYPRIVVMTEEDEMARVFGASIPRRFDDAKHRIVIRTGGTLAQCIEAAQKLGSWWILVY